MAMLTITAVFLKYIPLVLNFKAYSLDYGFISSFLFFFYYFHILTRSAQSRIELTSHLNQVDLRILLNP